MPYYKNPRYQPFKTLCLGIYKMFHQFEFEVQSNPQGLGGKQVLVGYFDALGELNTYIIGQEDIGGVRFDFGKHWESEYTGTFKLIKATPNPLRGMKVGDMIMDEDGDERIVIEVFPNTFTPSYANDKILAGGNYSFAEAERDGWKLIQPKTAPAPIEKVEMSKPKFKIGDVLIYHYKGCKLATAIFKVEKITTYHDNDTLYHTSSESYGEDDLSLYTE